MPAPHNRFKAAIESGQVQIGCWLALASGYTAEAMSTAGFDWLVIDGEHAPNDLQSMVAQLQAIKSSSAEPVIRVPVGETWLIKQVLDIGCQTLLVPMVESAEQAQELVRAVRYPPQGVRGVGSALARASNFGTIKDYLKTANDQICLLVQVESRRGLKAIEEIAAVDGIDGIFIGPSDLAADMGALGEPSHPEVQAAVEKAIDKVVKSGLPVGILTFDQALVRRYIELGVTFAAVGAEITLMVQAAHALARIFKS